MHELSLMHEIFSLVKEVSQDKQLQRIYKIKLVVGEHTSVMPHSLQMAFDLLKKEPFTDEAVMDIERAQGDEFYIDYFEGE